jgi:protein-tyrosine phosphatase
MKKIIFVCLGNICRSPAAEAIFLSKVSTKPYFNDLHVESAGTSGAHCGEFADQRMREHASSRGYELATKSRRFSEDDILHHDYILAMDQNNIDDILKMDPLTDLSNKLLLMTNFCKSHEVSGVPDPYYGGPDGFEEVLDILEDAIDGFIIKIENEL